MLNFLDESNENNQYIKWLCLDKYYGIKGSDFDFVTRSIKDVRDAEWFKDIYFNLYKLLSKDSLNTFIFRNDQP